MMAVFVVTQLFSTWADALCLLSKSSSAPWRALNPVKSWPLRSSGRQSGHLPRDWLRRWGGFSGVTVLSAHLPASCFIPPHPACSFLFPCVSHLWLPVLQNNAVGLHVKHTYESLQTRPSYIINGPHTHTYPEPEGKIKLHCANKRCWYTEHCG